MKMMLSGFAVFSLLLFIGANFVFAEDSVSISVSCTVPAIPGVNAPLLEAQSIKANPALLTSEEEDQSSEGQKDIVLVKTFYVR
jgi:hypothetical protein